jgi:hypothetical protein
MAPPTYGSYVYPGWAIALGWIIAMCSIVPMPAVAVYRIAMAKGSLCQVSSTDCLLLIKHNGKNDLKTQRVCLKACFTVPPSDDQSIVIRVLFVEF